MIVYWPWLLYAVPAWYGCTLANDRARIVQLLSTLVRMYYLPKDQSMFYGKFITAHFERKFTNSAFPHLTFYSYTPLFIFLCRSSLGYKNAIHHCTFSFITARFVHHYTLKQTLARTVPISWTSYVNLNWICWMLLSLIPTTHGSDPWASKALCTVKQDNHVLSLFPLSSSDVLAFASATTPLFCYPKILRTTETQTPCPLQIPPLP